MAAKRRRRRSNQRNLLYDEPSWWGIVALGVVIAVIVVALFVLVFRNSEPGLEQAPDRLSLLPASTAGSLPTGPAQRT